MQGTQNATRTIRPIAKKAKRHLLKKGESIVAERRKLDNAQNAFRAGIFKFIAGGAGGLANCIVGHPLDTIKVIMQSDSRVSGRGNFLQLGSSIVSERGLTGLYKGIVPPATMGTGLGACFFLISNLAREAVCRPGQPVHEIELHQTVLAAQITAPAYCFFANIIDVVKCRLQADQGKTMYKSTFDCFAKTYHEGGLKAFMQGFGGCYGRRVIGLPCYFATYDITLDYLKPQGGTRADVGFWGKCFAGGTAGVMLWSVAYPFDVIKTMMHVQGENASEKKRTMTSLCRHVFRTEGLKGFYRGITPALARSFPANGVYFGVFDLVYTELNKKFGSH
eukprot:g1225.t1